MLITDEELDHAEAFFRKSFPLLCSEWLSEEAIKNISGMLAKSLKESGYSIKEVKHE